MRRLRANQPQLLFHSLPHTTDQFRDPVEMPAPFSIRVLTGSIRVLTGAVQCRWWAVASAMVRGGWKECRDA